MLKENRSGSNSASDTAAYLVVRQGHKPGDVIRLTPGQVTTIGRASTNRIVIRDDICSRKHCEIFQSDSVWVLRDLGSRNGTSVNGSPVERDRGLKQGGLIRIGPYELGFTFDLALPFPKTGSTKDLDSDSETAVDLVLDSPSTDSEPAIIHRKRSTRYRASDAAEKVGRDRTSQELAKLYRLALEMGSTSDSKSLSRVVLAGLLSATSADIGAILLLPEGTQAAPTPSNLRVIAYEGTDDVSYQKVSDHLSQVVFDEREAVLACDVSDDSQLANRDSLGEIHAKSVICAPIRISHFIFGLVHLYATDSANPLEPDDLEFTLAVADQMAVVLDNVKQKESLAVGLARAQVGLARAQNENLTLRRQLEIESKLIGESPTMSSLREEIARAAPTGATVLIRGESGVGKELVARAIHFGSPRRNESFICMNCAALSESLLESELFGHEKGAFTGATDRKFGKFEQAHNGTIFLDEVGEMSTAVQAKFLRVLEGHPFERIGGGTPIHANVRVVAATNTDLEAAVKSGRIRKDLYYRLNVVEIVVDPLRDRLSDLPLLANYFLERFARKSDSPVKRFSESALDALMNYDWPGNVRELQNAVERAVILSAGLQVAKSDIQLSALGSSESLDPFNARTGDFRQVSLEIVEQEHILATLERTNWNKSKAAQILKIERSTLDRKLKRYQVSRPSN